MKYQFSVGMNIAKELVARKEILLELGGRIDTSRMPCQRLSSSVNTRKGNGSEIWGRTLYICVCVCLGKMFSDRANSEDKEQEADKMTHAFTNQF